MKPSVFEALEKDDKLRKDFFKACVLRLGLTVNEHDDDPPSLSPIHLSSIGGDVSNVLEQWEAAATSIDGEAYIKAEVDTFHIQSPSKAWSMEKLLKTVAEIKPRTDANERAEPENEAMGNNFLDYGTVMKELVPHNEPPTAKSTPYFNHRAYYSNLQGYRKAAIDESQNDRLGHYLLYGEVVTSTSTLLEKYVFTTLRPPSFVPHRNIRTEIQNLLLLYPRVPHSLLPLNSAEGAVAQTFGSRLPARLCSAHCSVIPSPSTPLRQLYSCNTSPRSPL